MLPKCSCFTVLCCAHVGTTPIQASGHNLPIVEKPANVQVDEGSAYEHQLVLTQVWRERHGLMTTFALSWHFYVGSACVQ